MIRVKRIAINGSTILLKDKSSMQELKQGLGSLFDVSPSQVTFTYDEIEGTLTKEDPIIQNLQKREKEQEDQVEIIKS